MLRLLPCAFFFLSLFPPISVLRFFFPSFSTLYPPSLFFLLGEHVLRQLFFPASIFSGGPWFGDKLMVIPVALATTSDFGGVSSGGSLGPGGPNLKMGRPVVPALTHPAWPCPSFLWPYLSPTSCEAQTADINQWEPKSCWQKPVIGG